MRRLYSIAFLLSAALVSCESRPRLVTQMDAQGNYRTTSDYQAMDREEFESAMRAGLQDYLERVDQLRARANELGGEHLRDFSSWAEELEEKRIHFVNELEKSEVAMIDNWPEQREDTLDAYYDLRECLDEAYSEVLET